MGHFHFIEDHLLVFNLVVTTSVPAEFVSLYVTPTGLTDIVRRSLAGGPAPIFHWVPVVDECLVFAHAANGRFGINDTKDLVETKL